MYKYGKDLFGQIICNNLLCFTVYNYTKNGIKIQCKILIFNGL